ncbi:hypothetical protein HZB00_00880 [Candidatus Woesearchaeota archaeon]|nr:hypothetical protein [Candidatus Woesearchaeota archaeon]
MPLYKLLVHQIQKKRPLDRLDPDFVVSSIEHYFKTHPKEFVKLKTVNEKHLAKNAIFRQTVKEIRNELNRMYGIFWKSSASALEHHISTKERMDIYPHIYQDIFRITHIPRRILDLGSGLNPLSYPYLEQAGFCGDYIAVELTKKDCDLLRSYFLQRHLKGEVLQRDLVSMTDFPSADVTFLFKVVDLLETNTHTLAERILTSVPSLWIVVSFSTKTLRGHTMRYPSRGWIEQLCKRLHYSYQILLYENEIFYIIKK